MKKTLLRLCMPLGISSLLLLGAGCASYSDYEIRMKKHERKNVYSDSTKVLYDCTNSTNPEEREKGKVLEKGRINY